jgi:DNA-binding MurR/RpiR family transcriptional regulator
MYLIHSCIETCSVKEKKVGEYILANPAKSVHPSIDELAAQIGVSVSTLVRFVKKLGYEGYQEFRIALATETMAPEARIFETSLYPSSDPVTISFTAARSALEMTERLVDSVVLENVARKACEAEVFFIFGIGGSGLVAADAVHKFIRSGIHCQTAADYHLQLMMASQSSPRDLALVISHTGTNKDTLAIVEELRKRGCDVAAITTYPRSPLARRADYLLLSGAPGASVISEAFSARIAHLAIIDALYIAAMGFLERKGLENMDKMRQAIAGRRL